MPIGESPDLEAEPASGGPRALEASVDGTPRARQSILKPKRRSIPISEQTSDAAKGQQAAVLETEQHPCKQDPVQALAFHREEDHAFGRGKARYAQPQRCAKLQRIRQTPLQPLALGEVQLQDRARQPVQAILGEEELSN